MGSTWKGLSKLVVCWAHCCIQVPRTGAGTSKHSNICGMNGLLLLLVTIIISSGVWCHPPNLSSRIMLCYLSLSSPCSTVGLMKVFGRRIGTVSPQRKKEGPAWRPQSWWGIQSYSLLWPRLLLWMEALGQGRGPQGDICTDAWAARQGSPALSIQARYPFSSRSICCCRRNFIKALRFSTLSLSLANSLWTRRIRFTSRDSG